MNTVVRLYMALWAMYALFVSRNPERADLDTLVILGLVGVAALFWQRMGIQIQVLREQKPEKKVRRQKKQRHDDIPDDPKIDWALEVTRRMAQGPTTMRPQSTGPVQYNLWGEAEPIRSEQIVRQNNEPDWPSFEQMHPDLFRK